MRSYWSALAKLRKAEEEMVISEIAALTQGPPEIFQMMKLFYFAIYKTS